MLQVCHTKWERRKNESQQENVLENIIFILNYMNKWKNLKNKTAKQLSLI